MSGLVEKSNFSKICRTCLESSDNMTSVFDSEIANMLQRFTTIQVHVGDQLPEQICITCVVKINESWNFKQVCENADQLLRQILTTNEDSKWLDIVKVDTNGTVTDIGREESSHLNVNTAGVKSEPETNVCNLSGSDDDGEDYYMPAEPIISFNGDSDNKESANHTRVKKALMLGPEKCDPTTLTCKICNKVLVNIHSLGRHMEMHDKDRKFNFTCTVCKKGFYEKGHLTKHMRRHKGETRYKCEKCAKAFYELSALAVHMRRHRVKPIPCTMCKKQFMVQLQLDVHMKTHMNEKGHVCTQCGKSFYQANRLRKHQLSHVKERLYPCLQCDKTFKDQASLKCHYKRCHTGEPKRDVCNICGKAVTHIKVHMLKHSTERPFKCAQCPRAYACKSQLKNHCKMKHFSEGELQLYTVLCSTCGKRCQSTTELKVHMRKHTGERPYACHLCPKKYKTGNGLTTHMRSHTGERPYVCTVCLKGFYTSQILKHHIRIHTGERPYVCQVCERAFTQNSALKTHMKIHSNA